MAGIGFSMMKKRKEYRPMQDSMNGPNDTKTKTFSGNRTDGCFQLAGTSHTHVWKGISVGKVCNCKHLYSMLILM